MTAIARKSAFESLKTPLFCLALIALLLRSFIPAGFMPEAGKTAMVICTASGPATIEVNADQDAGHTAAKHAGVAHAPCVFAPGFVSGTVALFFALPAPPADDTRFIAAVTAQAAATISKPYSSQAPPRLS